MEMQIEVGKTYRAKNGEEWTVKEERDGPDYQFLAERCDGCRCWFRRDGRFCASGFPSDNDLIEEVEAPETSPADDDLIEKVRGRIALLKERISKFEPFLAACGGDFNEVRKVVDAIESVGGAK